MTSVFGVECNDEYFDSEDRIYYYCNLDKGHKGDHKHVRTIQWENKK